MATVLYRKYRPQTFRELTNQNHVKITLEQSVAQDKFGHAYVFSGPRGIGKTSIARILAKALNCTSRKKGVGEPCNKCSACQEITEGRSLDVLEIDAASYTGVDTVREVIIETARFASTRLKFKIFIIDEMHMLSTSAWNALLKILEEPPAHVIFIFATTEIHKVPATILSRCQRFDFKRISAPDLIERLKFVAGQEKRKVALAVLHNIARLAEGSVRDAESLLEQVFALGEKEITEDHASIVLPRSSLPAVIDFLKLLFANDTRGSIDLINHYLFDGFDLSQFASDIVEVLRKMLLLKTQSGSQSAIVFDLSEEHEKSLRDLISGFSLKRLLFYIELFLRRQLELKTASIPQLPLELAVIEACGEETAPSSSPVVYNYIKSQKSPTPHPTLSPEGRGIKEGNLSPEGRGGGGGASVASTEPGGPGLKINLAEIKTKWPQILQEVQKENNSLPFILKLSAPVGLEKGIVKIGVSYKFHRDKLNEAKNQLILAKILEQECGEKMRVEAVLIEQGKTNDVLEEALKTFGGKVVE